MAQNHHAVVVWIVFLSREAKTCGSAPCYRVDVAPAYAIYHIDSYEDWKASGVNMVPPYSAIAETCHMGNPPRF